MQLVLGTRTDSEESSLTRDGVVGEGPEEKSQKSLPQASRSPGLCTEAVRPARALDARLRKGSLETGWR